MRTRTSVASILAAGMLAVAACGTGEQQAGAGDDAPAGENPAGETSGSAAPLQFTSETLDGAEVDGAAYADGPAVFWFWTPWCPVCASEAPEIAEAQADYGDEVDFVGVAADDELANMHEFVANHELGGFEHLNDAEREVWTSFDVTQQPAYAFVDEAGEVELVRGSVPADDLHERLDAMTGA